VTATGNTMFSSEAGTSVTAPIGQAANVADDAAGVVANVADDAAMTSIPGVSQASQMYTANPSSMQIGAQNALSSPVDMSTSVAAAAPNVAGSAPIASAPPVPSTPSVPDIGAAAITPPATPQVAAPVAPAAPSANGVGGLAFDPANNPFPAYTPPQNTASVGQNYTMDGLKQMADPFKAASPATPAAPGMWASMPEWAKYAAMTSGAQGLTGLASGYFQGLSAEEKLKFEKLVNDQRQQQVNLTNTRSAFAPRVSFNRAPGGLVNA
jgi:hypothetical protein